MKIPKTLSCLVVFLFWAGGYAYANTHAVTSIGSIAYIYDENGNML